MSDKVLPVIFLNLSGEMMYVIQQRLEAQNISEEKSRKVMQDIIFSILNYQFLDELFKPQPMYSRSAMQSVFERLVHSSIMRLNSSSMSKLYDLMLMVFKYQVVNCEDPEEIMLVTLNHVDAIKNCSKPYPELAKGIENVYSLLNSKYKGMPHEDYECLFNCIVLFLQDLNIRVSVLMKLGLQSPNGEIIPRKNNTDIKDFKASHKYDISSPYFKDSMQKAFPVICFDPDGNRRSTLGKNIYIQSALHQPTKITVLSSASHATDSTERTDCQVLEDITLLSRLIGKHNQSDSVPEIIFSTNDDSNDIKEISSGIYRRDSCSFVNIDASQVCQMELGKISNEFSVSEEKNENKDILELLDIAENGCG